MLASLSRLPRVRAHSERRQHRQHNAWADHRQGPGSRQKAASLPTHGQGQPWTPDGTDERHRGDGSKRQGHISRSCMDAGIHRHGQLSCPPSCVSFAITSSVSTFLPSGSQVCLTSLSQCAAYRYSHRGAWRARSRDQAEACLD
jgi:hypothetical protein